MGLGTLRGGGILGGGSPARACILGETNWKLPRILDRILPRFNVEGHAPPLDAGPVDAAPVGAPS